MNLKVHLVPLCPVMVDQVDQSLFQPSLEYHLGWVSHKFSGLFQCLTPLTASEFKEKPAYQIHLVHTVGWMADKDMAIQTGLPCCKFSLPLQTSVTSHILLGDDRISLIICEQPCSPPHGLDCLMSAVALSNLLQLTLPELAVGLPLGSWSCHHQGWCFKAVIILFFLSA